MTASAASAGAEPGMPVPVTAVRLQPAAALKSPFWMVVEIAGAVSSVSSTHMRSAVAVNSRSAVSSEPNTNGTSLGSALLWVEPMNCVPGRNVIGPSVRGTKLSCVCAARRRASTSMRPSACRPISPRLKLRRWVLIFGIEWNNPRL
jgi:hypothetical protein